MIPDKNMDKKQISSEIIFIKDKTVKVANKDIDLLKRKAVKNLRRRIRLCAHPGIKDNLHEMIIIHTKDAYIRPHLHLNKSESFHIIEGSADVIIFDRKGKITDLIRMGDYLSGKKFYYRISSPAYHSLLIRTEFLAFHEVTNGPFKRDDTIFAPWSPQEEDHPAKKIFMQQLKNDVSSFILSRKTTGEEDVRNR